MKKLASRLMLLLILFFIPLSNNADEGMWLINSLPLEKLQKEYGIELSDKWIEKVKLSSIRFESGGSGSFISPNGLVLTNHHVAMSSLSKLSSPKKNYVSDGYYAESLKDELKCVDEQLRVLNSIKDVTEELLNVPGETKAEQNKERKRRIADLEKEYSKKPNIEANVVSFYSGKIYHLYIYKKYNDVRLVFAPEMKIAFFGGDPMNFTYPRYNLDMAIFRVYENNKPAKTPNYFAINPEGTEEGELVFISGHPGHTQRLKTISQLLSIRESYSNFLDLLYKLEETLIEYSAKSTEHARQARGVLFGVQNSRKAIKGYLDGLNRKSFWIRKALSEIELQIFINSSEKLKKKYGNPFEEIRTALHKIYPYKNVYSFLARMTAYGKIVRYARAMVQYDEDIQKPNGDRLEPYQEANLDNLERQITAKVPIYKELEKSILKDSVNHYYKYFKDMYPELSQKVFGDNEIDKTINRWIDKTKVDDVSFRKKFWKANENVRTEMIKNDPLLSDLRLIDPTFRKLDKLFRDEYQSVVLSSGANIAQAMFDKKGSEQYPDATFTLRLSFGKVKGYEENGKSIYHVTYLKDLYTLAKDKKHQPPYDLPKRWLTAFERKLIDDKTKANFISTADIIGGNSGSPAINSDGEIVGLIFDGNIYSLAGDFYFDGRLNRAVSVHADFIVFALKNIYKCDRILKELTIK